MDNVTVTLNQQEMDVLTDLIDRAIKNPTSGGLQALDGASMILNKLRMSVMEKQLKESAASPPETQAS